MVAHITFFVAADVAHLGGRLRDIRFYAVPYSTKILRPSVEDLI